MRKYPKLRRPGHPETEGLLADQNDELVITEKCDGNNVRFTHDDGELHFGSRNCIIANDPERVDPMFADVVGHVQTVVDAEDLESMAKAINHGSGPSCDSVTLFGENAVEHTLEYRWDEVPQFQLFDVWVDNDDGGFWLDWDSVQTHAGVHGLATVPEVERMDVVDFHPNDYEIPDSEYRDGVAEGIVVRNTSNQVRAKIISEEFAEKHKSAKSKNYNETDADKLVDQHCTPRRVEKCVQTLLGEPDYDYDAIEMEMMEDLHELVWEDVWAEGWHDIIYTDWEIEFETAHSRVASRTATHLRELMKDQTVVDPGTGETAGQYLDEGGEA